MQLQLTKEDRNEFLSQVLSIYHKIEMPQHFNKKGPKIFNNFQRIAIILLYIRSKESLRDLLKA